MAVKQTQVDADILEAREIARVLNQIMARLERLVENYDDRGYKSDAGLTDAVVQAKNPDLTATDVKNAIDLAFRDMQTQFEKISAGKKNQAHIRNIIKD